VARSGAASIRRSISSPSATPTSRRKRCGGLVELVDVRPFGPGERIVPQPYTREMLERSHAWMESWDLLDTAVDVGIRYEDAML
jgi:NitT/TauT family transport system substrate-binding protein